MTDSILSFLIENTVTISILIGAVWLIKTAFKKQLSAMMQYAIWGIVILKLLIPVSMSTAWSPINLLNTIQPASPTATVQKAEPAIQPSAAAIPDNTAIKDTAPELGASNTLQTSTITPTSTITQPKAPTPMDWNALIMWAWLAGAAGYMTWLCIRAARLKRKVRRCTMDNIPQWMQELLLECRWRLGIKREIKPVLQGALPVPAIMGLWHPVLMVPAKLASERDYEKMRHVFLHELMHYKRRDLPVIWLLNLLQAAYWWNPLVWISFRMIHRDMETVCDSQVLKVLGTGRRKEYIGTILSFSGKQGKRQVQAALNLNDGCTKMEKRIHGMFLKKRTKGGIKAAVIVLACAFLFAGFTTGCQPTPEKPVIAGKNDGQLEQKIAQQAPVHKYEAPAKWQDSISQGRLEVSIDAAIETPDVDQYPVYMASPAEMTQNTADKLISVLMQGKTIYPTRNMDKDMTKSEILAKMAAMEAGTGSDLHEADPEAYKKFIKPQLESLQKMLAKAPDTIERKPSDGKLIPVKDPRNEDPAAEGSTPQPTANSDTDSGDNSKSGYAMLRVEADLGQAKPANLQIDKNADNKNNTIIFASGTSKGPNQVIEEKTRNLPGLKITAEQGAEMAKKIISDLGLDDMQIAAVASCATPDMADLSRQDMTYAQFPRCYAYLFTHTMQGMPENFVNHSSWYRLGTGTTAQGGPSKEDYSQYWIEEYLNVYVNDSGVILLEWRSPTQVNELVSKNVELLPFEQIQERFSQQMKYEGVWAEEQTVEKRTVYISRVRLGMALTPVKDKPGQYMYVPAWDFYGYYVEKMSDTVHDPNWNDKNENVHKEPFTSFITINAIDGSIINRTLGN